MAVATEPKTTMHVMDVLHTLIDKSGADESLRLDMHDAIDAADKDRIDAMDESELTGRRAPIDRTSGGVGVAATGLTKADLDKAVASAVAAALAEHGIGNAAKADAGKADASKDKA